jgi:hypothetical protein
MQSKESKDEVKFIAETSHILAENCQDIENESHVLNELQYFIFVYCFLFRRRMIISRYYLNLVFINLNQFKDY